MPVYALQLPDHLMRKAKEMAEYNHTTLDQFLVAVIAERIGMLETHRFFADLAAKAEPGALRAILDRVPDAPPVPGDEIEEEGTTK